MARRKAKGSNPKRASQAKPGASFHLQSPSARELVPALKHAPYWEKIVKGIHLGWRRADLAEPGVWYVKWEVPSKIQGQTTERKQERLGFADDLQEADGDKILDHSQAHAKAQDMAKGKVPRAPKGDYSVGDVLEAAYDAKVQAGHKSLTQTRSWINKTKSEIGELKVATLEKQDIEDWLNQLVKTPPRVRSKKGQEPKHNDKFDPNNADHIRARKVSANKSLRQFKMAMNLALDDPKNLSVTSDAAWKKVPEFSGVEASRGQALTPSQSAAVINACNPEFRPLAFGGLLTGLRYGELICLKVRHFRPLENSVVVDFGKTENRFAPLTEEGIAILLAICKGRAPEEPMFLRADGTAWGHGHQNHPMRDSCLVADVDACFYLLRHTCITRWAESGIPLNVIANAVGNSVTIIEKHYQHLTPGGLHRTLTDKVEKFGICDEDMEEARAELDRLRALEGRGGLIEHLSFRLNTLHPSEFAGKIRGGTMAAPKRPTQEELTGLVEQMSLPKIAERYEVNEAAVRKWCKKWQIKTKPRGYWAKVYARELRTEHQSKGPSPEIKPPLVTQNLPKRGAPVHLRQDPVR